MAMSRDQVINRFDSNKQEEENITVQKCCNYINNELIKDMQYNEYRNNEQVHSVLFPSELSPEVIMRIIDAYTVLGWKVEVATTYPRTFYFSKQHI